VPKKDTTGKRAGKARSGKRNVVLRKEGCDEKKGGAQRLEKQSVSRVGNSGCKDWGLGGGAAYVEKSLKEPSRVERREDQSFSAQL